MLMIGLTLFIAFIGAQIAKYFKLPAPYMTGSMIGVSIFAALTNQTVMPSNLKTFAQIISGAYIGQQITKQDLKNLPKMALPIIFLLSLFTINTFLTGWLFVKFFHFDWITGLLSCLPGGIMDVSLISMDMKANAHTVATLQFIRLAGMLLILPYWIELFVQHFHKQAPQPKNETNVAKQKSSLQTTKQRKYFCNQLFILLVASLGGLLGLYLQLPVGALSFSLLASIILKLTMNTTPLDKNIRFFAQLIAGSIIGSTFTDDSLLFLRQLILPAALLLFNYLIVNLIFGLTIYRTKRLDLRSALFASSPAGATDISLIAGDLGGDMTKIALIQISRTLYTILVLPQLIQLFLSLYLAH